MRRVFTIGYFLVGALVPVTRDVAAALVEDLGLLVEPEPGADDPLAAGLAVEGLDAVLGAAGAAAFGFFWKLATKVTEALRF
jgi:hypothetical protein